MGTQWFRVLRKRTSLRDTYRGHERITVGFGPHSTYAVDEALLEKTGMLAAELDAPIQIHLHETSQEVLSSVERCIEDRLTS